MQVCYKHGSRGAVMIWSGDGDDGCPACRQIADAHKVGLNDMNHVSQHSMAIIANLVTGIQSAVATLVSGHRADGNIEQAALMAEETLVASLGAHRLQEQHHGLV